MGKLKNGIVLTVQPYLIKRQAKHIYIFDFGVKITLGCNGKIWLSSSDTNDAPSYGDRQNISIIRAIIQTIASHYIIIHFDMISEMYKMFIKKNYKIQNFDIFIQGTELLKEYLSLA